MTDPNQPSQCPDCPRYLDRCPACKQTKQPSPSDKELFDIDAATLTRFEPPTSIPLSDLSSLSTACYAARRRALFEAGRESMRAELDALQQRHARLTELLAGFEEQIAGRRAELTRKGGQHVPHHGDFSACAPSALNRLEWWARAFREVLK